MPIDPTLSGYSFKASNFKCFADQPQGFDELKPMNIIIGRNNTGKSALLDLIRVCILGNSAIARQQWHTTEEPKVELAVTLSEQVVRRVFSEGQSGNGLPGDHWNFGRQIVGARFSWQVNANDQCEFVHIDDAASGENAFDRIESDTQSLYGSTLGQAIGNPLRGKTFRLLAAERDIRPELDVEKIAVTSDGSGATNIIQNYVNQAHLDHDLIEKKLLDALNSVFKPDADFTDIKCHQNGNAGPWEIHLLEPHKGRVALSQSGSGLKTVMLVLINLLLVPIAESKPLSDYVFAFEELENNLHPALLRRLLAFIADLASKSGFLVFLTTHSSAAIDLFSKNADAQIIHVRHDGKSATAVRVQTYIENAGVLDDLDIRASDLLQANCIIWVEGPSDRIYINRWISLWSNAQLKEGVHYQCVFYGGRLLSHLEACSPDEAQSGIPILRLARHACVVIDSDKRAQQTRINDTKKRIESEVRGIGGFAWITKGREIENYIPKAAIESWKSWSGLPDCDAYADVFETLETQESGLGKRYREKKPLFAEVIAPLMTKENCLDVLDLAERMGELIQHIRNWNRLPE